MTQNHKIIFERVENASSLSSFYCGLKQMDDFIHDLKGGLNLYVELGLTNLWTVKIGEDVVAIFALSKSVLTLNSDDRRYLVGDGLKMDEAIFENKDNFPAIEIDYLAVSEKHRERKIGSFVLNEIAMKACSDQLSATMFLTVEALVVSGVYSAVGFYKKNGFKDSEHGVIRNLVKQRNGEVSTTRRMYRLLYKENVLTGDGI